MNSLACRLSTACAAGVVFVAACSGGGFPGTAGPGTEDPPSTATTAPPAVAPLTGLPVSAEVDLDRPALAFKVDNSPAARQDGLAAADVVYEEVVEGGVTRLMAVYHSTDAGTVGPIRSVRPTDIELVEPLGNSILIYSGGQPKVLEMVRRAGLDTRSDETGSGGFARDEDRKAPHDLMSSTDAFWQPGADPAPPRPVAQYSAEPPAGGTTVSRVTARFSSDTSAIWTAGADGAGWVLTGGAGRPDPGTSQATPSTLVFLKVRGIDTGLVDSNGGRVPGWLTTGSGDVVVVRNGTAYTGQWTRPGAAAAFTLRTASGSAIPLAPGPSWWSLVPADGKIDLD